MDLPKDRILKKKVSIFSFTFFNILNHTDVNTVFLHWVNRYLSYTSFGILIFRHLLSHVFLCGFSKYQLPTCKSQDTANLSSKERKRLQTCPNPGCETQVLDLDDHAKRWHSMKYWGFECNECTDGFR